MATSTTVCWYSVVCMQECCVHAPHVCFLAGAGTWLQTFSSSSRTRQSVLQAAVCAQHSLPGSWQTQGMRFASNLVRVARQQLAAQGSPRLGQGTSHRMQPAVPHAVSGSTSQMPTCQLPLSACHSHEQQYDTPFHSTHTRQVTHDTPYALACAAGGVSRVL